MRSFLAMWFVLAAPVVAVAQSNVYIQTVSPSADDLYIAGRYEEALAAYREMYHQSGDPEFLFKMARTLHQLGQRQPAIEAYQSFLASLPGPLLRDEAERHLEALQTRRSEDPDALAPLAIPAQPSGATTGFSRANKLFRISAVTGAAALVTGAATAFAAIEAQNSFAPGDEDVDMVKFAALAALTDALVVTSISTGIAGYVVRKRARNSFTPPKLEAPSAVTSAVQPNFSKSKKLFRISGTTAAAGVALSAATLVQTSQLSNLEGIDRGDVTRVRTLAAASDMLLMTAVGTGVAGLVIRKKEKRQYNEAVSSTTVAPVLSIGSVGVRLSW